MAEDRSQIQEIGCRLSGAVADVAANPFAQLGFILLCVGWFAFGLRVEALTAALSMLAITLTQMVLNRQQEREKEAHRRDAALHAKLDELVYASKRARDAMAGIEDLEEEQIEELRATGASRSLDSVAKGGEAEPAEGDRR
jgi:low affinity Fe/Cu permease